VPIQGGPYRVEEVFAIERLAEKGDGASLQGAPACLVVAVGGEDDCGNSSIHGRQAPEEAEAIHAGHTEIEHQTAGLRSMDGRQKGFSGRERLNPESDRPQEISEGSTQRFIVVYD